MEQTGPDLIRRKVIQTKNCAYKLNPKEQTKHLPTQMLWGQSRDQKSDDLRVREVRR